MNKRLDWSVGLPKKLGTGKKTLSIQSVEEYPPYVESDVYWVVGRMENIKHLHLDECQDERIYFACSRNGRFQGNSSEK